MAGDEPTPTPTVIFDSLIRTHMDRWQTLLRRWGPREDADESFYPDGLDAQRPVLLNSMGPMAAALVAARLLRAVVVQGGTRIKPSAVEALERLVSTGLSEEVVHHCRAEAERILEWLDRAPPAEKSAGDDSESTDLELMMKADIESRLSVARFALNEGYDLELEYFDDESRTWPRTRACVKTIEEAKGDELDVTLRLFGDDGEFTVSLKQVRWLMPVPASTWNNGPDESSGGELVEFPGTDYDR